MALWDTLSYVFDFRLAERPVSGNFSPHQARFPDITNDGIWPISDCRVRSTLTLSVKSRVLYFGVYFGDDFLSVCLTYRASVGLTGMPAIIQLANNLTLPKMTPSRPEPTHKLLQSRHPPAALSNKPIHPDDSAKRKQ